MNDKQTHSLIRIDLTNGIVKGAWVKALDRMFVSEYLLIRKVSTIKSKGVVVQSSSKL